eukprot:m.254018 g.254018  ORF g.254018 m.254018 type:complete len:272 (+) comp40378_c0_seq5:2-817(+)
MLEFGMNSKQPLDVIDLACRLSACYSNLKESKTLHTLRINNLENTPDSLGIICNKQKQLTECYFELAYEALHSHQFQEVDRLVHLGFGGRSPYELTDEEFTSSTYSQGLDFLVRTYVNHGLCDKAQKLLSKMIEVYSSRPSTKDQLFFAYIAMASLHGDQGNYQKQLDMLDFAQSSISQLQLPLYYRECGKALEGLNRHEEALVYFTKTLDSLKIVYPGNSPLLSVVTVFVLLVDIRKQSNSQQKALQWQGLLCLGMHVFVRIFFPMRQTY